MTAVANIAKAFAFPARNNLEAVAHEAGRAREAQLETARAEAIARGHAEGLARGREEARVEARELLESSYREGDAKGHADGLAEINLAKEALHNALDAFALERAKVVAEAESFCVDLALAIVARLVEADATRAEFVRHSIAKALQALAPEAPTAVFVNPADLKCIGSAVSDLPLHEDATLASGTSRVEAGRLLVESALDEAFNQLRTAVLETRGKRGRKDSAAEENPTPKVETLDAV
jgi:flagellar biosynthesis/type III secretory pathway protein FliH